MHNVIYIDFTHTQLLNMDEIFRYLVDEYKTCGVMPFIGGYECTFYGNEKLFDYKVIVILIEE